MGSMEEKVREMIIDTFGSVPKFAKAIDLPPQTVYSALRNSLIGASLATVIPIAAALRIDPFQLAQNKVVPLAEGERGYADVPLYGRIAAGVPSEPVESNETFPIPAELAEKHPNAFLLVVSGESMNRVLPDGCYALVEPCRSVEASGNIYAVAIGQSDATVKRVQLLDNGLLLEPDSTDPTFKPYVFDYSNEQDECVRVIGRVVWFCPPLNWTHKG